MAASPDLRALPSVDQVLGWFEASWLARFPRRLIIEEIRIALAQTRQEARAGTAVDPAVIRRRIEEGLLRWDEPCLRGVINATGVVLHTNLGRAPLPASGPADGYSNLEYDLQTGRRGNRDTHIADLLERLAGAPGIAVNNNAAALYLALNELAAGFEVIISRGELIEIGDGFRIPDIMLRAGVILREVGTTNRTTVEDYRAAITDKTRLLLRVHPSNFHMEGFTAKPLLTELVQLSRAHHIPLYEDLGSGCMVDLRPWGIDEPLVSESIRAGVDLVSFSGDKLLGGPQSGILAGRPELVQRLRRNPMFRALRLDKLIYGALETTLRLHLLERWSQIPALAMIMQSQEGLYQRALQFQKQLPVLQLLEGESVIGGGSTPNQSLPTWLLALPAGNAESLQQRLRSGEPPVIARIENDGLVLDLRTVLPHEEAALLRALQALS